MAIAIVPQLPSAASAENQKGALNKTSYDFRATVKNIGMNEMGRVLPVSELFMNSRNFSFGPKTRKTGIGPKTAVISLTALFGVLVHSSHTGGWDWSNHWKRDRTN